MDKSRTEHSARNAMAAVIGKTLTILAGFCTRVVFTRTLSQEYVGINALFFDILNVLALSELGTGAAITYALYRPISEGDIEKQKSLMRMFRHFYGVVAGVVLAGGLAVVPFLDVLMKDPPDIGHLLLIYLLYLCNSVLSYTMVYKQTLVMAHQLSYLSTLCKTISSVLQNLFQIVVLVSSGNFLLFVCVMILCTLLNNVSISAIADQLFPYLRDRNIQDLPPGERKAIFQNTRAMLMHKIGLVMVKNTDNLLLSALVGIISSSLYSNYYLIIGSVRQVLQQVFSGITASVGNLGVETDKARVRRIFEASFFLGQWAYGLAAICLYELIDPFIGYVFGKHYVFSQDVTLILCINFYLTGMREATHTFRDSLGVFWYDRYQSLLEAAVNLVVSIILGRWLGTAGVFLGTLVSTVSVPLWVEPMVLYRYSLGSSSKRFFLRYGLYASVTFLLWYVADVLCRNVDGGVLAVCSKRLLICMVLVNLAYFALYHRTKEFRLLAEKGCRILARRRAPGKES